METNEAQGRTKPMTKLERMASEAQAEAKRNFERANEICKRHPEYRFHGSDAEIIRNFEMDA